MPTPLPDNDHVYVEFEHRAMEDRKASTAAGHYVARDAEFVRITPPGGNLVVEREVTDQDRARFARQYEAWRKGVDAPEDGTPIRGWPPVSPAQIDMCIRANLRTVEALAQASEQSLQRLGIGARALQTKARAWLESARDHGVVAEEVAALKTQMEAMAERNRELQEALDEMRAAKPRRGRPPKVRDEGEAA